MFVCHANDRGYIHEGMYYSQLLNSIQDMPQFNQVKFSSFSTRFSKYSFEQTYGNSVTANRYFFILKFLSFFIYLLNKKKRVGYFKKKLKEFYIQLIKKSKPKIIIVIQPEEALCEASHENNIPIFDFQHGVIVKKSKYYKRFFENEVEQNYLPTGVLCWDDNTAELFKNESSVKNLKIYSVGNPWHYRFLAKKNIDPILQKLRESEPNTNTNLLKILVTLQWGLHVLSSIF